MKPRLISIVVPLLFILFETTTAQETPLTVETTPLDTSHPSCSGTFVTHTLDHKTTVPGGDQVRMFEANGGGVAINDLDGDGRLDIVLANHAGQDTILWNEGHLQFTTQRLPVGDTRAVNIVDVDGDGRLDIVITRRATAPNFWRNMGNRKFEQVVLPGVSVPLYAMTWVDFDGDGDLDLIGATYDAGLLSDMGQDFLTSGVGGVYYYENRGGKFIMNRISGHAQALALVVYDVDGDGKPEILVGNDFAVPDQIWHRTDSGWEEWKGFSATAYNTMSFDYGDIENNGRIELFASDMKPYTDDQQTRAAWGPIIRSFREEPPRKGDPQTHENVLQVPDAGGKFTNESEAQGVDATGWSWSGKFGDLNQDGFLDLYVVNGMMEATTFAHLPKHELVEDNRVFRNDGKGHFVVMPEWGLGSLASGRGMSMADLDSDGDLDIVVNNLLTPAQLFENQLCEGSSLQVDLRMPNTGNTRALGATLILHTSMGDLQRDVRASSGYLSGDPARIHFGFPEGTTLKSLDIRWPDGQVSSVDKVAEGELVTVTRGT